MQTYDFVLQMPGNKAYAVPCERLQIYFVVEAIITIISSIGKYLAHEKDSIFIYFSHLHLFFCNIVAGRRRNICETVIGCVFNF